MLGFHCIRDVPNHMRGPNQQRIEHGNHVRLRFGGASLSHMRLTSVYLDLLGFPAELALKGIVKLVAFVNGI